MSMRATLLGLAAITAVAAWSIRSRDRHRGGALVSGPRLTGMDQLGFDSHPLDDAPLPQRVNPVTLIAGRTRQLIVRPRTRFAASSLRPAHPNPAIPGASRPARALQ